MFIIEESIRLIMGSTISIELLAVAFLLVAVIGYTAIKKLRKEAGKVKEIRKVFSEMHLLCSQRMGETLYDSISDLADTKSDHQFMKGVISLTKNEDFLHIMQKNTDYAAANEKFVHLDELVRSHIMVREVPR